MILRGVGDFTPPDFLVDAIKGAVADPSVTDYLRSAGTALARTTIPAGFTAATSPSPPNPWIKNVLGPILDPLSDGFKDETTNRLLPVAAAVAGVAVLAGVGIGAYFWRRSRG